MEVKEKNLLLDQVKHIRDTIVSGEYETDNEEGCNALDYLEDVLDINYYVDQKKEYLGARILVAFGGPNIWIDDNDLGNFSTLGLDSESIEKPKRLYQILTDTGSFTIQGIKFMDYNSAIEQIMGDAWSMDQGLFSV